MKKLLVLSLAVIMLICLSFASAFAGPSSKVIWNVGEIDINIVADGNDEVKEEEEIFRRTIKVSDARNLIVNVSLECELKTNTLSKLDQLLSEADVKVMVSVLVDDEEAQPGEVTFARRFQALKHVPGEDPNLAMVAIYTTGANSFNFIKEDVSPGAHDIVVQANVVVHQEKGIQCSMHDDTSVSILKGSVIVEGVKIIKGKDSMPEL
jgi:hypothetical protein